MGTGEDDGADTDDAVERALSRLRTVADYQFGAGAGQVLFPPDERPEVRTSVSGRPRQVIADAGRVVSYGTDGLLTLGVVGGRRLVEADGDLAPRVVVGEESAPYVREGRNAFAKFVRDAAAGLRPRDEAVVLVDEAVVGVGRAVLWPAAMEDFESGVAVEVRHGAGD